MRYDTVILPTTGSYDFAMLAEALALADNRDARVVIVNPVFPPPPTPDGYPYQVVPCLDFVDPKEGNVLVLLPALARPEAVWEVTSWFWERKTRQEVGRALYDYSHTPPDYHADTLFIRVVQLGFSEPRTLAVYQGAGLLAEQPNVNEPMRGDDIPF